MMVAHINPQKSVHQPFSAHFRRFMRWLTSPHVLLTLIMLALMIYLIIIPLFRMVITTLTFQEKDIVTYPDAVVGSFTLYHWIRMLTSKISQIILYTPLQHSLVVSAGATIIAAVFGCLMAWFVIRTDMPGRKIINVLAIIPYMMPSWTISMAWTVLFKNRTIGGAPGILEFLLGKGPPDWFAYGPVPIMISSGLHYYTFFFLFVSAALMSIDSNLEEAGEIMGANRWRILRKITFPLVLPALMSGFIMTFSRVMGTFGGPNILGVPVRYYTLSTMIRADMKLGNNADGFVLALMLIAIAIITVFINQKAMGTKKSFETIGGRGLVIKQVQLRSWRIFLTTLVITTEIIIAVIPASLLLWNTFMKTSGDYSLSNLSLIHWIGKSDPLIDDGLPGIFRNPAIYRGAWNSIKLAFSTAFFSALLGVILGYAIVKGRGTRLSKIIEQLAFIPYVIPGIAFGAVYISMFAKPVGPIPALYGTFALLIVVSVAKNLPFSSRTGVTAMMQVGKELEEAAMVAGANAWLRFTRILFPLTRSGFVSGFLLTFITTMRELSLIILLVTPATQVLASMTMRYTENGSEQKADAVIILLIVLILGGNWLISRFRKGSLEKGLGI
ncbi:MAG: iron ABC transporter permease [Chloroflexi bacterium HGW-Chloroflexi-10]|nr:MAG: iron ABC transporter permease [Chloroflexi bacterium HGW-Chloroflexi-10]